MKISISAVKNKNSLIQQKIEKFDPKVDNEKPNLDI